MKIKENNIKKLVKACKKGDSLAQYQIFDMYAKSMYNTAIRFFNNQMQAEDMVQEAFISAFNNISAFNGDSSFVYWLKRILINKCITEVRKQKIKFETIDEQFDNLTDDFDCCEVDTEIVSTAISKLPSNASVVLNLYIFEDYKHKEIAEMLNITESTSRTQYRRAKLLLADMLDKNRVYN